MISTMLGGAANPEMAELSNAMARTSKRIDQTRQLMTLVSDCLVGAGVVSLTGEPTGLAEGGVAERGVRGM
ncbi:hypothetical protein [Neorhodopirellula lusitana]|uniref:hypothetical protein n=1 Tax=Neorhodopirellula lusitana TaxID=445327 RepID=UPI003850FFD9